MIVKSISGRVPCVFPHEWVRLAAVAAAVLLICLLFAAPAAAVDVATIADLKNNISKATGDLTITITHDIPVSATDAIPVITGGKNIILTSGGGNHKIYRTGRNTSKDTGMFTVDGGSLKIDTSGGGTLTLDGGSEGRTLTYEESGLTGNDQSLVYVNNSGTFTLDGGNIVNNTASVKDGVENNVSKYKLASEPKKQTSHYLGGGVSVYGGTFTMKSGNISGNCALIGGGVYVNNGTFTLDGGNISGNTALSVSQWTTPWSYNLINKKSIYERDPYANEWDRVATGNGGGVAVHTGGKFTMTGGLISYNKGEGIGGGVFIYDNGKLTMSGGAISCNTVKINQFHYDYIGEMGTMGGKLEWAKLGVGGGVGIYGYGMFEMSDGEISGNTAARLGGGVGLSSSTQNRIAFTMSGGEISGNTVISTQEPTDHDNSLGYGDLIGDGGGGLNIIYSKVLMTGGTISGNTAKYGNGVFLRDANVGDINSLRMEKSAIIQDNVYLWTNGNRPREAYIEVNEQMNPGSGARNITLRVQNPAPGTLVVKTDSQERAADVRQYFKLSPDLIAQNFGLKVVDNELRIAMVQMVDDHTVKIIPYNSTVANVSFNLTDKRGATMTYVNLTDVTSGTTVSTTTGGIAAGMGVINHQIADLTPGQTYQLKTTPWDSSTTEGTALDPPITYTAPVPAIEFVNPNTGAVISDPLQIANGESVVIRANITNTTYGELKNETIRWDLQGSCFQKSNEKTDAPYTITLTATAPSGVGNITVSVDGGSATKLLNLSATAYTVTYDVAKDLTANAFIRTGGYTFAGWATSASGPVVYIDNQSVLNLSSTAGATVTLYANWTTTPTPPVTTYTVTVQSDGHGTCTASCGTTAAPGSTVTLTASPNPGYHFKQWLVVLGGVSITGNTFTMPQANVKVIGQFEADGGSSGGGDSGGGNMNNAFRVLFETFGGSFISPVTGLSYGDVIPEPPAPTKEGYTFGGWYTDETCTKEWNFADGIPGDMTLYARWIGGTTPTPTVPITEEPTGEPTGDTTISPPSGTIDPSGNTTTVPPALSGSGDDENSTFFYFLLLLILLLCLIAYYLYRRYT